MFTTISVLVPTRQRIERLRTMIESFERTVRVRTTELVFRIDSDDLDTANFLVRWGQDKGHRQHRFVVGPRHDGYRSTPQFLLDAMHESVGDVLMVGNDDMVFRTTGWDLQVLEAANMHPDGLFDIGVETLNASHFPFSIISRRVANILGFVYDPRLFWGDIFLRDVMDAFGRTIRLNTVHVTHEWAGYKPDAVFAEANNEKLTIGTGEYWEKHRALVKEAVDKLCCVGAGV